MASKLHPIHSEMQASHFLFHSFLVFTFFFPVFADESAWNGHVTPGSTVPSKFTPYYVPPGSRAYDSTDYSIRRFGSWNVANSVEYINGSALVTSSKGAYLTFDFSSTGIEVYGGIGKRFGHFDIYIDGKHVQTGDNWANHNRNQQLLFFSYGLASTHHTLKIVNKGSTSSSMLEIDAFVIMDLATPPSSQRTLASDQIRISKPDKLVSQTSSDGQWTLLQRGSTGVAAMQLSIISSSHAIIIDKVEHNPLTISGHPAWGALYNLNTHSVKALHMQSNSFCAGGTFLSNGTLINVGGNPVVSDITSAADFGDVDGLQAIRLFHPCETDSVDSCDIYENHDRIRMASPRWYNTVIRIPDGSAMIIGGSKKGGWINNSTVNNPTVEYYPPKNVQGSNGLPIALSFLQDTLNSNLFPIAVVLPDGTIFMAANNDATVYDWQSNADRRLPPLPNGVRVTYPMTGTGVLLPLSADNDYTPEVLLCGGSTLDDTKPGYELTSQDPASSQCSRIVLTEEGISSGWQVEQMPQARIMPDGVLLPTGQILFVNGGASGISGYSNVIDQVGESNADNPVLTPVLYDPAAPSGSRFTSAGMPRSEIPRLYHSVASLTPNGDIMIAGSNPNLDRSEIRYGTEYRVEWLSPPYMTKERPSILNAPRLIGYSEKATFKVRLPSTTNDQSRIQVACMDLGFVTHAVHANARLVYLENSGGPGDTESLTVTGPPNSNIYPPGPAWIYFIVDGVPSVGTQVMIGDGKGPTVDENALNK